MSLPMKRHSFKTKYRGVKAIKPTMKDILTEVLAAHQRAYVAREKADYLQDQAAGQAQRLCQFEQIKRDLRS